MDRLQQKHELLVKLGLLFSEALRVSQDPNSFSDDERSRVIARYCHDRTDLEIQFREFCVGEPGHSYHVEAQRLAIQLNHPADRLILDIADPYGEFRRAFDRARAIISAIPVITGSTVLPAQSPFTTYGILRDLIGGATVSRLTIVDAYLDASVFHRYLRVLGPSVSVELITEDGSTNRRPQWNEFRDVSKLYAAERGPSHYTLISHSKTLHDRWLLLDDKSFFHLGGSLKDAGAKKDFTISVADLTPDKLAAIANLRSTGTSLFGPTQTTHV